MVLHSRLPGSCPFVHIVTNLERGTALEQQPALSDRLRQLRQLGGALEPSPGCAHITAATAKLLP
jgi:hypothetical protein